MPFVTDTSDFDEKEFTPSSSEGAGFPISYLLGRSRWQYGYRYTGDSFLEHQQLTHDQGTNWASQRTAIQRMDDERARQHRVEGQRRKDNTIVNDRDYTETQIVPRVSVKSECYDPSWRVSSKTSGFLIPLSMRNLPSLPDDSTAQNVAARLLREAAPAKPEFNLTRSLGELKDAPLLFRAANYIPKSPKDAAGAFLNAIFGIAPTISDLQGAAETVVAADSIIRDYLRGDGKRFGRKRNLILGQETLSGVTKGVIGRSTQVYDFGHFTCKAGWLTPFSSSTATGFRAQSEIAWSSTYTLGVRAFATYEYFVPHATTLWDRLDAYNQIATRVLGGGADASTVYDLTPWTWLSDWFVDVGGLLRFQQSVVDNDMVMRLSGWTAYLSATGNAVHTPVSSTLSGGAVVKSPVSTGALIRHRVERRRSGSPYSLAPSWDFNAQQWAILAALGIARSAGVPGRIPGTP